MGAPTTLHGLLARAAAEWPDAAAVSFRSASITYGELHTRVMARARQWCLAGVRPGDRVGIALPRSIALVEAVYASSACGAAYVPLDLASPPARLAGLVMAAGLAGVATSARLAEQLLPAGATPAWTLLAMDAPAPSTGNGSVPAVSGEDAAYVLFTSGSTGRPKGVVHTHGSALAFALWAAAEVGLVTGDRVAGHAGLHFDLSTFDLFAAAAAGATLCPVPEAATFHGAHQVRFILRERVTVWYSVPLAWLRMLSTSQASELSEARLHTVIFAGEVFPLDALRRLREALPAARLLNFYGPTETNVCAWHEVCPADLDPATTEPVPIGRAAAGAVLDVDSGGAGRGELLVAGPTVMRGYLGEAPLTRPYATGDVVEIADDGSLRFIGRTDRQVKIRGHRVEPGDVEAAIAAVAGVAEVAVLVGASPSGERELVAHVAPADIDLRELTAAARGALPPWMLPSRLCAHPALPRTGNGKIDVEALGAAATSLCYEPGR